MSTFSSNGILQQHWPVPLAVHTFEQAADVNAVLARVFAIMRATDASAEKEAGGFCASSDDLLGRVDLPEFRLLVEFIAKAVQTTAKQANAGVWPQGRQGLELELCALKWGNTVLQPHV